MIRYNPSIDYGLSGKEVNNRIKNGYVNYDTNIKTKSIEGIITDIKKVWNISRERNMLKP